MSGAVLDILIFLGGSLTLMILLAISIGVNTRTALSYSSSSGSYSFRGSLPCKIYHSLTHSSFCASETSFLIIYFFLGFFCGGSKFSLICPEHFCGPKRDFDSTYFGCPLLITELALSRWIGIYQLSFWELISSS